MKNILIINAHPDKKSFCAAQAEVLLVAAKKDKHSVSLLHAYDYPLIDSNPAHKGFPTAFDDISNHITQADVLVFCAPIWNFGAPAGLKNFLDGTLQAKKSFRFVSPSILQFLSRFEFLRRYIPSGVPKGLLSVEKVFVFLSADAPAWYYRVLPWKNAAFRQIKLALGFCGGRHFRCSLLGTVRNMTEQERKQRLQKLKHVSFS